jgi:hypothetical protein
MKVSGILQYKDLSDRFLLIEENSLISIYDSLKKEFACNHLFTSLGTIEQWIGRADISRRSHCPMCDLQAIGLIRAKKTPPSTGSFSIKFPEDLKAMVQFYYDADLDESITPKNIQRLVNDIAKRTGKSSYTPNAQCLVEEMCVYTVNFDPQLTSRRGYELGLFNAREHNNLAFELGLAQPVYPIRKTPVFTDEISGEEYVTYVIFSDPVEGVSLKSILASEMPQYEKNVLLFEVTKKLVSAITQFMSPRNPPFIIHGNLKTEHIFYDMERKKLTLTDFTYRQYWNTPIPDLFYFLASLKDFARSSDSQIGIWESYVAIARSLETREVKRNITRVDRHDKRLGESEAMKTKLTVIAGKILLIDGRINDWFEKQGTEIRAQTVDDYIISSENGIETFRALYKVVAKLASALATPEVRPEPRKREEEEPEEMDFE